MKSGTSPAETRVTWRHSGCRGLLLGIALSLVVLTACQAQGQTSDERAVEARPGPVAGRQTIGTFDHLAGEYRGTSKGDAFVVWVDVSPAVKESQQAALLIFREQDRPRLETYIKRIIDDPVDSYRQVCERAGSDERKGRLHDLYRVWDTQGGLVLLQDFQEVRLPPDWVEIEGGDYPPYLRTQEYIVWRDREYMFRRIRRSVETGALESVQLTQTGFIQNFFDNPVISVKRVDSASPSFKLLGSYLDAKFAARKELDASYSYQLDRNGVPIFPSLAEVCKTVLSNDLISHPK